MADLLEQMISEIRGLRKRVDALERKEFLQTNADRMIIGAYGAVFNSNFKFDSVSDGITKAYINDNGDLQLSGVLYSGDYGGFRAVNYDIGVDVSQSIEAPSGLLVISDPSFGMYTGAYVLAGATGNVALIGQTNNIYNTGVGASGDNTIRVYWSVNKFYIVNRFGSAHSLRCIFIETY